MIVCRSTNLIYCRSTERYKLSRECLQKFQELETTTWTIFCRSTEKYRLPVVIVCSRSAKKYREVQTCCSDTLEKDYYCNEFLHDIRRKGFVLNAPSPLSPTNWPPNSHMFAQVPVSKSTNYVSKQKLLQYSGATRQNCWTSEMKLFLNFTNSGAFTASRYFGHLCGWIWFHFQRF